VDFRHTIILMTSNIGSEFLQDGIDKAKQAKVLQLVKQHFRPEFLNRIDDLILFSGLSEENLLNIIDIMIGRLAARLKRQDLTIIIDDDAKKELAKRGYDPAYGARPLERLLQREVIDKIALGLIEKRFSAGQEVHVGLKNGIISVT
jgi:ATP-dependent Clp protease ATP-binding subunit ClpB